ncbi:MAG: SUMF1/EgtB/PvdO family nonheme iron enzyme [Phycisphaerales bacterium]|nr:MAG: SUMF1/EgtB/PvdO family nonheme iron enzyme [Phycisphaerales bacterium]
MMKQCIRAALLLSGTAVLLQGCGSDAPSGGSSDAPSEIKTKSGIEMVLVPGGRFMMGDAKGQIDEKPHEVHVSSFYIDKYPVTQEEYQKVMGNNPSRWKGTKNPVEQIRWSDAVRYCNARSRLEGLQPCYDLETWECDFKTNGYRLPTEAEWEYACRAGTETGYSFGRNELELKRHAWFEDNSHGRPQPVGQKAPNPWGLCDMHGNVWEWCNDFYQVDYYQQSPKEDPKGPKTGDNKVVRGGAWNSSAASCRSSYRYNEDPGYTDVCFGYDIYGFRCVRKEPDRMSTEPNPAGNNPAGTNSRTGFVYDDAYLDHKTTPGHPEAPQRLVAILDRLKNSNVYAGLQKLGPSPASEEWLIAVHTREYVERVRQSCDTNAGYLDSLDVPISARSYEVALLAAGGVLGAVDAVMEGKITNAFCAVRPPGHHAMEDRAMGFCIFNNVAIGARYIRKKWNLSKILIVDWDVHHGNGTQAEFYDDPNVLYFSVHQYPFYPGSGSEQEKGDGEGLNKNINMPLPAGSGDGDYLRVFREKLEPAALAFSPDFVLVSAGFDAHKDDLLGGMRVTEHGFAELTRIVKAIAEKCCEGRLVSVLEGGYGLEGLAASVEAHIRVLMG